MKKSSVKLDRAGEEAYQSHKLSNIRESSKIAALIAMGLFAAFAPLDLLTATANYLEVTLFRVLTVSLFLALYLMLRTGRLRWHPEHVSYLIVGLALFCITILTAMTGGHESSYYAGINLILLGSSLVFPWSLRQMTAMSAFSIVIYLLVMLIEAGFVIESQHSFYNNLSFLFGAAILSMAGSEFRDRIQRLSFMRFLELETARNDIQKEHDLKNRFFANLSHELRTPLALILGPTRRMIDLESAKAESSEKVDYLHLIERNAQQLLKHVNDLLEVSRIDSGFSKLSYNRADLTLLVKQMASNFENLAKERKIEYLVTTPSSQMAELDASAFERILMNLLSNAFKFTPKGGTIRVELQERHSNIVLTVSDSGPGISDAKRELVFERFYQVEDPLTRNSDGTGLGLSITKSLVELHKGRIQLERSKLGGAKFQIELPKKAPAGVSIEPYLHSGRNEANWIKAHSMNPSVLSDMGEKNQDRPLVLMIEDNNDFGEFMRSILSPHYRVAHASDGAQGVALAKELCPDLIISDIMMPKLSGDLVLEKIKKTSSLKNVPVLMLTAKADDDLRLRLLKLGASDYLIKPFAAEELLARIDNLVSLKVSTDLLRHELENSQGDLSTLIREITDHRRLLKSRSKELEQARESALKAVRLREEFISVASHELRTPLTSMTLQTQMAKWLLEQHPESFSPRSAKLIHIFDRQVDRLVNLVNGMFDFSAIRSGRLRLKSEKTDLAQLVHRTIDSLEPQLLAQSKTTVSGVESLRGWWDSARLGQVLSNLISNALKHGGGAPVEVVLEDEGDEAVLHIRDFGPGIPSELQERIFGRFERFTSNPAIGGLGLGLYISRTIIEAHHGQLTVNSKVGDQTTFTIRLPKSSAQAQLGEKSQFSDSDDGQLMAVTPS